MRNFESSSPDWKPLYEAALLETDASKLRERIMTARSAIFDRIEESFTRPQPAEHRALDDALRTLRRLSEIIADKRVA
jgi:inhibitor of KinA sporulation pathway (predicted exonuclease)